MTDAEALTRELLAKHLGVLPTDVDAAFVRCVVVIAQKLQEAGLLKEADDTTKTRP